MMVEWLFLAVPWGCLRFVIVVFPDHTHLLFFSFRHLKKVIQEFHSKFLLEPANKAANNIIEPYEHPKARSWQR